MAERVSRGNRGPVVQRRRPSLARVATLLSLAVVTIAIGTLESAVAEARKYSFFGYAGEQTQEYHVPSGAKWVRVEAFGGRGSGSTDQGRLLKYLGGFGARVTGEVAVHAGETLFVEVASNAVGATPGWPGGGRGGAGSTEGGGGGGASVVAEPGTDQLVAAGGGGGSGEYGGSAGENGQTSYPGGGGSAGSTSSGGLGGESCTMSANAFGGLPFQGGQGASGASGGEGGGGGGGGFYGGGGGGAWLSGCPGNENAAGGGGGSSFLGPNTRDGAIQVFSVPPEEDPAPSVLLSVQDQPSCSGVELSTPAGGGQAVTTVSCSGEGPLQYELVSQPAHGTVTLNESSGVATYESKAGYHGSDSFTYRATNSGGESNAATAAVSVPALAPPLCSDASVSTPAGGGSVVVSLSCTEPASGSPSYSIVSPPAHGTLGTIDEGRVQYTSSAGYVGSDSFTYRASGAGGTSNTSTVNISVPAFPISPAPSASGGVLDSHASVTPAAPRVQALLRASFRAARRYTKVKTLALSDLPPGATVEVSCHGHGCPFATLSSSGTHKASGCKHCRGIEIRDGEARLSALFTEHRLRVGASVLVRVTKPGWVGRSFAFTVRSNANPRLQTSV